MTTSVAVTVAHVSKRFPGVAALDDVSVTIAVGSCHALCGENGAGKSTLGRILAGIYLADDGLVLLDGQPVRFENPTQALGAGVAMVHQELSFCDNLSVAENLCLGMLPARRGLLDRALMRRRAGEMLEAIEATLDVDALVGDLSIGQQQVLQIAAAIGRGARLVIFDEPTSSLSQHEAEHLYGLIGRLREQGVTCLYVSHRLEEIFQLCDTVTVLRDGRHVATRPVAEIDRHALVEMMVGRRVDDHTSSRSVAVGEEMLRVDRLTGVSGFRDVSFTLRAGEVLGFAGLVGAGRSEVARAIFGVDPIRSGAILVRGKRARIAGVGDAIQCGLGLVPEDRKRQGLVGSMSVVANATLSVLTRIAPGRWLTPGRERRAIGSFLTRLRLRDSARDLPVTALSGGNQQKVVLTKWLAARCPILIFDEPTRGVDVGAKAEIHALIDELASTGTAVILISSEMPELLALSTRILVFRGGQVAGELARTDATPDAVMRLMAGVAA